MVGFKKIDTFIKTGTGVFVFAVAFFAAFLSSSHFMPVKKSSAETNGTYYANITSSGSIDISIDATPDGIGKVGKDTLNIDTNATAGYKLYLSTASSAAGNGLYLSTDPTKSITATTGTLSEPSKLATNTWGFAPSRLNDSATPATYTDADADAVTGSAVFAGVSEYGSEDIIYTNNSPSTAGTNSVDVYYGVNASTALPSGAYSNTVVYTAVVDAVNPSSEEITLSPTFQNGLNSQSLTISTGLYPGFSASDLGKITVTIGGAACTNVTPSVDTTVGNLVITCNTPAAMPGKYDVVVTIEKYNKIYTLTQGYEYKQIGVNSMNDATYMQDFSPDTCGNTPIGTTKSLIDKRDNKTYTVRRLNDGKCWMIQDLKLGGDTALTLTAEDTDLAGAGAGYTYTLPAEDLSAWCNEHEDTSCINRSAMLKTGVPNGYLYNWYTATAGTATYTTALDNAPASICPKGWKLPTGGPNGDFVALDIAYGGNGENQDNNDKTAGRLAVMMSTDNNGPGLDVTGWGQAPNGTIGWPDNYGGYWSSTTLGPYTSTYLYSAYILSVFTWSGSPAYRPQAAFGTGAGWGIRCVADIDTMQGFSAPINAPNGTAKTLKDTRDSKVYSVAKLADNNWWMTSDLKLDGGRTLTSADSDVVTNFDLLADNSDTWCTDIDSSCYNQSLMTKQDAPNGYYYNWYAATAGTGHYETSSGDVPASICSKGWYLPSKSEFVALDQAYGGDGSNRTDKAQGDKFMAPPLSFNYTGARFGSGAYATTTDLYYWSRTASNNNYAYILDYRSDTERFQPQNDYGKRYGFAIRCILE